SSRPSLTFDVATATTLGTDLHRGYRWNRDSTAVLFRPTPASGCRIGRKTMVSTTVRPNATRTSSSDFSSVSPPNRSSKAPGARQDCKRDLRRVKAIEVRGIHHRASHSFRTTKGDSAEFSAEV
ncbi:hypothetical protein Prudu_009710, partial [Prunus dulcis]